jgi:zinc protease
MTASSARAFEKVKETSLFNGEKLYEYKLSNGLKVLMLPRHQAQVVSYQVWFSVGSLDEKMDKKLNKTGLAHLFEHMMFRGTEKYPDGKFDELSSRLGTDKQNATTYYYRTNYFENIPVKNLEAIMELESDRMANLKLSADLIEKEKGAVVGEYRRHLDNPPSLAFEELMKLAYDEASPFHYAVIGTEDWIKGFTLEEAQYFYKTYYAPNNATIIAIGDITEKSFLPLVEKYYGEMKSQAVPEFKPSQPGV